MSGEQYTQVRRPVSRLAEKVLGWLSWIFLLLLTIITMFIALVSFSSEASIQNLETSLNGNDFIQQILANNGLNTIQFVIWLQNGVWAIIVYFIVCLLLSFLALISMNIRILSGFLFLVATIVTLPLVLLFVPLIIPILFLIVAIMMFARKEKVETVPAYYAEGYQERYSDYEQQSEPNSPQYIEKQQTSDVEQQQSNDNQLRRVGYSSEVAEKVNSENNASDEEPQVLSRQAKYNYKQRKHNNVKDDSQSTEDEFGQVSNVYNEDGEAVANEDQNSKDEVTNEQEEQQDNETELENQRMAEEEARRKQEAYEAQQRKQAEQEEQQRRKQEKAEEKARIKQEKKER
ncbi:MAG: lipoteichoic acid stability factor AuxB, partial [Staphylococcus equorum]